MNDSVVLLMPGQAAARIGVSTQTLRRWGLMGDAPPSIGSGRGRRYRSDELQAWLAARTARDAEATAGAARS